MIYRLFWEVDGCRWATLAGTLENVTSVEMSEFVRGTDSVRISAPPTADDCSADQLSKPFFTACADPNCSIGTKECKSELLSAQ